MIMQNSTNLALKSRYEVSREQITKLFSGNPRMGSLQSYSDEEDSNVLIQAMS